MPHLPNEIWLLIVSYSEPKDVWLSLRPVNRQLQQCAEEHFEREVLPWATLTLPVIIATYDVRNPIRGKVVFKPVLDDLDPTPSGNLDGSVYYLVDTEPSSYRPLFLTRWAGMQDPKSCKLDERRVRWELNLGGQHWERVTLHRPSAVRYGCVEGEARLTFEWRYTLTCLFKS